MDIRVIVNAYYSIWHQKRKKIIAYIRARYEGTNPRSRNWGIIKQHFRRDIKKYHLIFQSILVLEQLKTHIRGQRSFYIDTDKNNILYK